MYNIELSVDKQFMLRLLYEVDQQAPKETLMSPQRTPNKPSPFIFRRLKSPVNSKWIPYEIFQNFFYFNKTVIKSNNHEKTHILCLKIPHKIDL